MTEFVPADEAQKFVNKFDEILCLSNIKVRDVEYIDLAFEIERVIIFGMEKPNIHRAMACSRSIVRSCTELVERNTPENFKLSEYVMYMLDFYRYIHKYFFDRLDEWRLLKEKEASNEN